MMVIFPGILMIGQYHSSDGVGVAEAYQCDHALS